LYKLFTGINEKMSKITKSNRSTRSTSKKESVLGGGNLDIQGNPVFNKLEFDEDALFDRNAKGTYKAPKSRRIQTEEEKLEKVLHDEQGLDETTFAKPVTNKQAPTKKTDDKNDEQVEDENHVNKSQDTQKNNHEDQQNSQNGEKEGSTSHEKEAEESNDQNEHMEWDTTM
jgi:hypothetical protein